MLFCLLIQAVNAPWDSDFLKGFDSLVVYTVDNTPIYQVFFLSSHVIRSTSAVWLSKAFAVE